MPDTIHLPLTRGYVGIIDAADLDREFTCQWNNGFEWTGRPSQKKWTADASKRSVYAHCCISGHTLLLHRLIMSAQAGEVIDHENHIGTDCRRINLRRTTHQGNAFNRSQRFGRVLPKGVCARPCGKLFQARIKLHGKLMHLGNFRTPQEASAAYNSAASKLFGEFACLNGAT